MKNKPKAWQINKQITKCNFIDICVTWKILLKEENGKNG